MSKFKRTNRANTASKEVILVASGDQALASGALVNGTTSLGIADGQLGVLSWDFDGTVALGTFITAGVTAANVKAVKVLQGTPKSSAVHTVEPWEVSDKGFVESGILYRSNIRSVATAPYRVSSYSAYAVTDLPSISAATEYGAYVYLYGVRNDRDWGDNDEVVYESFETPDSLAGITDTQSYVLENLLYKFNTRSRLASVSNSAGIRRGNKNYIALAINTSGSAGSDAGQALGTITCASTPTTIPVMRSYDKDGNVVTTNLIANAQLIKALAKVIKDQADNASSITNQITAASTIEVIDPKTAGNGVKASGTLTATGNFTANDAVTIGDETYTFVATPGATANNVDLGADLATSLSNLAAAINGTGTAGTTYGTNTVANADVTAVATATTVVVTARTAGASGNSIVFTEDTDGGSVFSVTGSGTLTNGSNTNVDAFIFIGLDEPKAAYFDNIEQVMNNVEVNVASGLNTSDVINTRISYDEGTGQGAKWIIQNDNRYQLNVHTQQNQPFMEFFSKGVTYLDKDKNYTSTIIDYYDYEETLTTRQVTPKQLILLLEASATCTNVSTAVTNLASGDAISTATDDSTTVSSLEGILGAWLDSTSTYSDLQYKGSASSGDIFQ
jgi:hypothetical protein